MATETANTSTGEGAERYVDLENVPSMEDLLGESAAPTFAEGTVVHGKVVEKRESGVLVDIGYKAEGFVPRDEFDDWESMTVGQSIDVFLEMIEDDDHMPLISARRAELQMQMPLVYGPPMQTLLVLV